jgi:ABC-type sugar transport system ATPase subunit
VRPRGFVELRPPRRASGVCVESGRWLVRVEPGFDAATLLRALEKRGALVLDCDAVYHEMLRTDAPRGAVVTGVRPEEFSLAQPGCGLAAHVAKTTFLGRYVNYELAFDDASLLPDQAAIEFSQDIGTAKKIYNPGETLHLAVNPEKINVFEIFKLYAQDTDVKVI